MFGKQISVFLTIVLLMITAGCGTDSKKDFTGLDALEQEKRYDYDTFFRPGIDGIIQPYVGDTMPYYEDGVYYIYYLKDGGDSYNHSIYLVTTKDFVTYEEYDEPVLVAGDTGEQDEWIGTGSVEKVGEEYLLFYTGHGASPELEYKEKILIAKSSDLRHFTKVDDFEIVPPDSLGQKNDFRDPQAYYNPETGNIEMTVTASQEGKARIIKYSIDKTLSQIKYDGIIFTDPTGEFWNLECSDTFRIGENYYITYSAQDDTLWYASSKYPYGPYCTPKRLDGKAFYAAKHVEGKDGMYMVGWVRRSESPSRVAKLSGWGGNLMVHKLRCNEMGDLILAPVDSIIGSFSDRETYDKGYIVKAPERFMLKGNFICDGQRETGITFETGTSKAENKRIVITQKDQMIRLFLDDSDEPQAEVAVMLKSGMNYQYVYIQEGSVGAFYIDGVGVLTVRVYGCSGHTVAAS